MVRLTVLGSGSSGNCAVVSTGRTTLLIDAGLSAKQICLRLEAAGIAPGSSFFEESDVVIASAPVRRSAVP